jgi:hypothetical protein
VERLRAQLTAQMTEAADGLQVKTKFATTGEKERNAMDKT